jgi:hypothetical protein
MKFFVIFLISANILANDAVYIEQVDLLEKNELAYILASSELVLVGSFASLKGSKLRSGHGRHVTKDNQLFSFDTDEVILGDEPNHPIVIEVGENVAKLLGLDPKRKKNSTKELRTFASPLHYKLDGGTIKYGQKILMSAGLCEYSENLCLKNYLVVDNEASLDAMRSLIKRYGDDEGAYNYYNDTQVLIPESHKRDQLEKRRKNISYAVIGKFSVIDKVFEEAKKIDFSDHDTDSCVELEFNPQKVLLGNKELKNKIIKVGFTGVIESSLKYDMNMLKAKKLELEVELGVLKKKFLGKNIEIDIFEEGKKKLRNEIGFVDKNISQKDSQLFSKQYILVKTEKGASTSFPCRNKGSGSFELIDPVLTKKYFSPDTEPAMFLDSLISDNY